MARAKTDPDAKPRRMALDALAQALVDPSPKPVLGNAKYPGIFTGHIRDARSASAYAKERGWIELTGDVVRIGQVEREVARITPAGMQAAIEQSESAQVLRGILTLMQQMGDQLEQVEKMDGQLAQCLQVVQHLYDQTSFKANNMHC